LERKDVPHRVAALAQEHGVLLGKAEERIAIGAAQKSIAATLHIEPNTSVMLLDRLLLALDGQPVEWRLAHCNLAGGYFYLSEMA
jgi:DNA-binding GntR family transcriptional regulator